MSRDKSKVVAIADVDTEQQAVLMQQQLEMAGIRCMLSNLLSTTILGKNQGNAVISIMVLEEDVEKAREVLIDAGYSHELYPVGGVSLEHLSPQQKKDRIKTALFYIIIALIAVVLYWIYIFTEKS